MALANVSIYSMPPKETPLFLHAYDPATLDPPPLPSPAPLTTFPINLQKNPSGLSIPHTGNFLGLSIELSLASAVMGPNGDLIWPQFLNLMSTLKSRGGPPMIRVGGNTQEKAVLLDSGALPNNLTLVKSQHGPTGVTLTPTVHFTMDIMYNLANITQLLDVKWWMGIPLNDTLKPRLRIAEVAEQLLGDNIAGFQLGNEPDLYQSHGYRPTYSVQQYFNEFQTMLGAIDADPLITMKNNIGGPGVCCVWNLQEDILNAGYLGRFNDHLGTVIVERYPYDNCVPGKHPAQQMMNEYMMHSFAVQFGDNYRSASASAAVYKKPIVLLETNTGSCGGFPGLSNAFAATLWATDLAMQLASINFTNMMLHVGGQHVYYNPFVPPPTNESSYHQWTVGPVFYANLIVAEALGSSDSARVIDLNPNDGNVYTPAYGIYDSQGNPEKVLLMNYMTDETGASDYTAQISVGAAGGPQKAWVRYVSAPSVAWKGNITIGGQTFGGMFEADGQLHGQEETLEIPCPGGVCSVVVKAPEIALVFLTEQALADSGVGPAATPVETFTTSRYLHQYNTATVNAGVLETSNGQGGSNFRAMGRYASTSRHANIHNAAERAVPGAVMLAAVALGAILVGRR
ncbi:hypothetical protein EXIGLDRAFT_768147 [Exidia glandulosa HHB12029]|uniref:Beta-glucuronidase C-terminal domain-containing protein n=1 Tax=Exidia glandulosa HHB12029 TaxID=1314781 RepID=A0A165IGL1_EXIGL|nr:hypothetical protein EXIGLDRAFT_768147 [Exidia glandulosa HHB12029]